MNEGRVTDSTAGTYYRGPDDQFVMSLQTQATWSTTSRERRRRAIRCTILRQADIVCATLSASGHEILAAVPMRFSTIIIDEASQSVELSTLIPMQYGCRRCILVGGKQSHS
jgi:hypothetical protein